MWARIVNYRVAEVTDLSPEGRFHPSLTWVDCSPQVKPGWRYDGEQCMPPETESVAELAQKKCQELDRARDADFTTGTEYTFPGSQSDHIQIRPEDKANLLAIAMEARDLKAAGESNPVIDFRAASNTTYQLTPNQAIDMTNAALAHVKAIYEKSWQLKDAVDAALQAGDREGIETISW